MRKISILTLALAFTVTLSATTPYNAPDERCRQIAGMSNQLLKPTDVLKLDLETGLWESLLISEGETASAATILFQFHEYGMMDKIITEANGETKFESSFWRVENFGGKPFLILSHPDSSAEVLYKVEQTCEGLVLTNIANEQATVLEYRKKSNAKTLDSIKSSLSGKWSSITYPFDLTNDLNRCGTFETMKDAYLKYAFAPNGTYRKNMGTAHLDIEESGYWELSADGKFLILHATKNGIAEQAYSTIIAEIAHINDGEMVLKQALHGAGDFETLFCTENKTFFFNKD